MGKAKVPSLAELEVTLREEFQTYRRRLDMVLRFKTLGRVPENETHQFIDALNGGDEPKARKIIKVIEVQRG